jgi:diketogulonate reductase-like aldo/keto reductase
VKSGWGSGRSIAGFLGTISLSGFASNNVVVEAYAPLVQDERANEPVLTVLAKKYHRTFAQVLVR